MSGNGQGRIWGEEPGRYGSGQPGSWETDQESALRIMEALSGVDAMLLERSEAMIRRKKPVWQYGRAWAAAVCAAAVGILTWGSYQFMADTGGADSSSSGNMTGGAMQMSSAVVSGVEYNGDGSAETETAGSSGNMSHKSSSSANLTDGAVSQEGTSPSVAPGGNVSQEGTSPSVAPGGNVNQGGTSPSVAPGGNANQGGTSPSVAPGGNASQGGTSPSVAPGGNASQEGTSPSVALGGNESGDGNIMIDSATEGCGVLAGEFERLTEEEARSWEVLGAYIPDQIPKGYVFESASWYEDRQMLTILWCKGMDDIHLSIRQAEDCETVDITRTETYDVRLYEIPYGETVPQEYRSIFDNPIFAWEDFSMEMIESRMRSYEDRGDTNTPRGRFSILFPDGVLVEFNGRGTTGQIWEMFQSLGL